MPSEEILIIGTDPPCPRCDYLKRMVVDGINDLQLTVTVRHVGYTGDEARRIASSEGLSPGTAKDVDRILGIGIDWPGVYNLIDSAGKTDSGTAASRCCPSAATQWTPELDAALRPCEMRAREAGILMTPVLVINGRPVHQGCVPEAEQVREWIVSAFPGHSDAASPAGTVVEVLGPGCEKCDTLYSNALAAVAGLDDGSAIVVKKRTDIGYFHKMGVAITPGLVINGEVVSTGRVLTPHQILAHLDAIIDKTKSNRTGHPA